MVDSTPTPRLMRSPQDVGEHVAALVVGPQPERLSVHAFPEELGVHDVEFGE